MESVFFISRVTDTALFCTQNRNLLLFGFHFLLLLQFECGPQHVRLFKCKWTSTLLFFRVGDVFPLRHFFNAIGGGLESLKKPCGMSSRRNRRATSCCSSSFLGHFDLSFFRPSARRNQNCLFPISTRLLPFINYVANHQAVLTRGGEQFGSYKIRNILAFFSERKLALVEA